METYRFKSYKTYSSDIIDQTEAIGLQRTSDLELTGKGVRICILDSGLASHSSLKPSLQIANFSSSKHSRDIEGHSHAVAGIIAANNGIIGLAPDSSLIYGKITDDKGIATADSVSAGLLWAAITGCHIAVISHFIDFSNYSIQIALDKAYSNGVIVCIDDVKLGTIVPSNIFSAGMFGFDDSFLATTYLEDKYLKIKKEDARSAILSGIIAIFMEKHLDMSDVDRRFSVIQNELINNLFLRSGK